MSRSLAIIMEEPRRLALRPVTMTAPGDDDVVVATEFSGVSTGTERLLYQGLMPTFPGMGYPLVPGYETVGRVIDAGARARDRIGSRVFVPGAHCFTDVHCVHGGAASRLVAPASRVLTIPAKTADDAVLLALAATALHALETASSQQGRVLIVGHGVLGRLLARMAAGDGRDVVVWETNAARRDGAAGYRVIDPQDDARKDYNVIYDVSGDASLVDTLVGRLARNGEIVLAGFYDRVSFAFPPAFMRHAKFSIAAQWAEGDLAHVSQMVSDGGLSLDGLVTHRRPVADAKRAYEQAFGDADCLKMVLDWRDDS
jgi:3-hydroxyethyl bacteriochlorophyllide a dehydrogenase